MDWSISHNIGHVCHMLATLLDSSHLYYQIVHTYEVVGESCSLTRCVLSGHISLIYDVHVLVAFPGWDTDIDIQRSIQLVRAQRSGMVQTEQQYKFVYMAIKFFVESEEALKQASHTVATVSVQGVV